MNCFRKSQLNFLNNPVQRKNENNLLHARGCAWYVKKRSEATTTKERGIKKKTPKRGGQNKDKTNQG